MYTTTFFEEKHFSDFDFEYLLDMRSIWGIVDTSDVKDKKEMVNAIIATTLKHDWTAVNTYELKEDLSLYDEITDEEKKEYYRECVEPY